MKKNTDGFILIPVVGVLILLVTVTLSFHVLAVNRFESIFEKKEFFSNRVQMRNRIETVFVGIKMYDHGASGVNMVLSQLGEQPGFTCVLEDEAGKININTLIASKGEQDQRIVSVMKHFLWNVNVKEDAYETIIDWIDDDNNPLSSGAEQDFYAELKNPYGPRNDALTTLEELSLIHGFSKSFFPSFLTVYSAGRININTASREVLAAVLDERTTGKLTDSIIQSRKKRFFSSTNEILTVDGMTPEVYKDIVDIITVTSDTFRIRIEKVTLGITQGIECYVRKSAEGITILSWKEQ